MTNIPQFLTGAPVDIRRVGKDAVSRRAHRPLKMMHGRGGHASLCPPYDFCHSLIRLEISAVTGSRIAEGVREKRGAGAGWVTPWR